MAFTCTEYRGLPVAEAIEHWAFESIWGLLVDGSADSPLPGAEDFPLPVDTGDHRVDMQSALAGLAPVWGFTSLLTTTPAEARRGLARSSVTAVSFVAQSARGSDLPAVQSWEVDKVSGTARRFLTRWQGKADERFVRAINAAWIAVAADPCCPSIEIAARTAATGADIAACLSAAVAATSGPLVAGAAARIAQLVGEPDTVVEDTLIDLGLHSHASASHTPRADALRRVAQELATPHEPIERIAAILAHWHHPHFSSEQLLTTLWATHLFTFAGVPERMLTAMFACGKTAGWSATILSQHARLLETSAR